MLRKIDQTTANELLTALIHCADLAEECLLWRESSTDPEDYEVIPLLQEYVDKARAVIAKAKG